MINGVPFVSYLPTKRVLARHIHVWEYASSNAWMCSIYVIISSFVALYRDYDYFMHRQTVWENSAHDFHTHNQ